MGRAETPAPPQVLRSTSPVPARTGLAAGAQVATLAGPLERGRVALPRLPAPQSYWSVALVVAITHFGFDFASPFLPIYVQQLGVDDPAQVVLWGGVLIGASPLVAVFAAPLWGLLADRYGARFLIMRSLVGFFVSLLLMAFATNPFQLLALRGLTGFFGGFTILASALVAVETPKDEVSKALGVVQAAQFIPLAAAPLVGGLVVDALGVRSNFLIGSGMVAAALAVLLLTGRSQSETRPAEPSRPRRPGRLAFILVPLLAGQFATRFVDGSFLAIVPLYLAAVETRVESLASMTGLVHSAGAVAVTISAAAVGHLAARRNPVAILVAGLVGGAVLLAALTLATSAPEFLVLRILVGLLAGGTMTLIYTSATNLLPREYTGRFFGLAGSAGQIGRAIGPSASGALGALQLGYVFWLDGALYALAALSLLFWLRMAAKPQQPALGQKAVS